MAGVFDVLKTAEHNQNSAIRPEQETSQDSLFVLVLVTTARIFRSRMKRKFHVRPLGVSAVGWATTPPTEIFTAKAATLALAGSARENAKKN